MVGVGSTLEFTQGWCDIRRMPLSIPSGELKGVLFLGCCLWSCEGEPPVLFYYLPQHSSWTELERGDGKECPSLLIPPYT